MERTTKENEIHAVLKKYNVTISPLCDIHVESLYELYINHDESAICESLFNDGDYLTMIGAYYHYICKNEVNMFKFYNMAIALGNSRSMIILGCYYKNKKDIPNMLKYYEMAVDLGNSNAMNNLGCYYQTQKDIPNMLKYYEMAVALGNSNAMNNLGFYYNESNDIPNMVKYYEMAIAQGDSNAMNNLGCYYQTQNDIPNMVKYYEMAIAQGDSDAMNNLGFYYDEQNDIPNMVKYYGMAIEHGDVSYLETYLSEILKDNSEIPYDKAKIEMFIRKADMKEKTNDNMKLLKLCIKYAIHVQDDALFFHLYEKYKMTKSFETFHLFYMARRPFIKIETCPLCMEEKKEIIPFDCICHGYCVMCTLKIKECGMCKIPKHPHFAKMFNT